MGHPVWLGRHEPGAGRVAHRRSLTGHDCLKRRCGWARLRLAAVRQMADMKLDTMVAIDGTADLTAWPGLRGIGGVSMKVRYGLISADSHVVLDREAFTRRISKAKWGDRIPQVVETTHNGKIVDAWRVDGKLFGVGRGVVNCPAAMDDPEAHYYPQRWEE